jgi:hypothetical protein
MDYPLFTDLFELRDCCVEKDCVHSIAKIRHFHSDLDTFVSPIYSHSDIISPVCLDCNLPPVTSLELVEKLCVDNIKYVEEHQGAVVLKQFLGNAEGML